jgi:hypothetical protein
MAFCARRIGFSSKRDFKVFLKKLLADLWGVSGTRRQADGRRGCCSSAVCFRPLDPNHSGPSCTYSYTGTVQYERKKRDCVTDNRDSKGFSDEKRGGSRSVERRKRTRSVGLYVDATLLLRQKQGECYRF